MTLRQYQFPFVPTYFQIYFLHFTLIIQYRVRIKLPLTLLPFYFYQIYTKIQTLLFTTLHTITRLLLLYLDQLNSYPIEPFVIHPTLTLPYLSNLFQTKRANLIFPLSTYLSPTFSYTPHTHLSCSIFPIFETSSVVVS